MNRIPKRIKARKIEYSSLVDGQEIMHHQQDYIGKPRLSARSISNERQASFNKYEANQLRQLSIERLKGVHYVEYALGRPQQRLRFALALNSPYTVFRCSQYVRSFFLDSFSFYPFFLKLDSNIFKYASIRTGLSI